MLGKTFNRLTVIEFSHTDKYYSKHWRCSCLCGNTCIVRGQKLISGHTKSCGCITKEKPPRFIDGRSKEPLYKIYYSMLARCNNPKSSKYYNYGKLGITVCKEWQESFDAFKEWALASGYAKGLSLDRIDVYGMYAPHNCRWATASVQMLNKRPQSQTPYITFNSTKNKWVGRLTVNRVRKEICVSANKQDVIDKIIEYILQHNLVEQKKVLINAGFNL